MIVTSVCVGHHVTGLKVGAKNARRYFPRGTEEIELRLDHLCIECVLAPDFWQDQAEIQRPKIMSLARIEAVDGKGEWTGARSDDPVRKELFHP